MATATVFFAAILGNYLVVGAVVMYLHDIADIPATLARALSSTEFEQTGFGVFICLLICWIWTRLYILPQILYKICTDPFPDVMLVVTRFNGAQLGILQLLHIYWFFCLIKIA